MQIIKKPELTNENQNIQPQLKKESRPTINILMLYIFAAINVSRIYRCFGKSAKHFESLFVTRESFVKSNFENADKKVQIAIKQRKLAKNSFVRENIFPRNVFVSSIANREIREILIPRKLMPAKIYAFKVITFHRLKYFSGN